MSAILQNLNWCDHDQRRTDSRLLLLYKVTSNFVAIPSSDYLIQNICPFSVNYPIAYWQITTLKDFYKYTFFPGTIIHLNALPHHIPTLPTLAQFGTAVYQVAHSTPLIPAPVLSFNYTDNIHSTVQTDFTHFFSMLLFRLTPFSSWYIRNTTLRPPRRFRCTGR